MGTHIREQAMVAFLSAVTGLATTGSKVTRSRVHLVSQSELPHLSVYQGSEVPQFEDNDNEAAVIHSYYRLQVLVEVTVEASSGSLETSLNQVSLEVADAINADVTLGLAGVLDTFETGHARPEIIGEKEKRTGKMEMEYSVVYRRLRSDASLN